MPALPLRNVLHHLELPARHAARTNVPHFAALDDVVQRLHDLLHGRIPIQPVDLEHINISPQALDGSVDGVQDVFAAQTHAVDEGPVVGRGGVDGRVDGVFLDAKVAFGQDDDVGPRDVVLLEGFADEALGAAVRVDVGLSMQSLSKSRADRGSEESIPCPTC